MYASMNPTLSPGGKKNAAHYIPMLRRPHYVRTADTSSLRHLTVSHGHSPKASTFPSPARHPLSINARTRPPPILTLNLSFPLYVRMYVYLSLSMSLRASRPPVKIDRRAS